MLRAALVVLTLAAGLSNRASAQNAPLFIRHVAVVDVKAGQVLPDMTVEIRGRTIAAMSAMLAHAKARAAVDPAER